MSPSNTNSARVSATSDYRSYQNMQKPATVETSNMPHNLVDSYAPIPLSKTNIIRIPDSCFASYTPGAKIQQHTKLTTANEPPPDSTTPSSVIEVKTIEDLLKEESCLLDEGILAAEEYGAALYEFHDSLIEREARVNLMEKHFGIHQPRGNPFAQETGDSHHSSTNTSSIAYQDSLSSIMSKNNAESSTGKSSTTHPQDTIGVKFPPQGYTSIHYNNVGMAPSKALASVTHPRTLHTSSDYESEGSDSCGFEPKEPENQKPAFAGRRNRLVSEAPSPHIAPAAGIRYCSGGLAPRKALPSLASSPLRGTSNDEYESSDDSDNKPEDYEEDGAPISPPRKPLVSQAHPRNIAPRASYQKQIGPGHMTQAERIASGNIGPMAPRMSQTPTTDRQNADDDTDTNEDPDDEQEEKKDGDGLMDPSRKPLMTKAGTPNSKA